VIVSRRGFLQVGGLLLAGLPSRLWAEDAADVRMMGDATGADVWFDPVGLLVRPGARVTWRNDDPGNSHTTTAFHPANRGRPLRIPPGADPWNSDYLLPGETFSTVLTVPGVYDYFCIPHEMAGMVGRIVVLAESGEPPAAPTDDEMYAFPPVADIIRQGEVHRP
jgi:plastocyanin